ncbi:hypothetical protein [Rickettsia honei]|uniref:hypothetical protein n=1 Tax=Rickettsia honei TaxID=37816 RepID=UPI00031A310C|nr:hypothetical protein [Rickettsia honei]
MKVFSLNNQPILKENKFENSILFLSTKINENGDVDYSEGFSTDIANGQINASYITPLSEIMDSKKIIICQIKLYYFLYHVY